MSSSLKHFQKYGDPSTPQFRKKYLVLWDVPNQLEIGVIPKRIYCNKDIIQPLTQAFSALISTGAVKELKTWDGCWNFRPIRGYEKRYQTLMSQGKVDQAIRLLSIHSWACAIDVNAAENGLNRPPKLSKKFVKCFKDAGFIWGGDFSRPDGMHFELSI